MNAKISDICKATGLSIGTVSEALKGKTRVAEKTRKRVQEVAKQLNYVPSNLGRALQAQRSSLMGYFCIDITMSILGNAFHETTYAATENDYGILFQAPKHSFASEIDSINFLLTKNVECIITSGCEPETWAYLLKLKNKNIPVIATACYSPIPEIPYVVTDDYMGGKIAANYLLEMQHKNMVFFQPNRPQNLREDGFKDTLMENGIRPFETCNSVDQLIQTCLRASSNRITAIFAYCDFDALIAKHTVEKLGLRIPEDISIIGFDNSTISSIEEINLSTFAQSTRTIGKQTIENAIKLIKGKNVDSVLVPPTFIKRDSTALCSA